MILRWLFSMRPCDGLPHRPQDGVLRRLAQRAVPGDARAHKGFGPLDALSHLLGVAAQAFYLLSGSALRREACDLLFEPLAHLPEFEQGVFLHVE